MRMMNYCLLFGLLSIGLFTSCNGGNHISSSKGYLKSSEPQNNPTANNDLSNSSSSGTPIVDKTLYVPFSRELQMKLAAYNVDIKKVQFYLDTKLVLTRTLDSAKAEVASGSVRFTNGKLINEIIVPAYIPGVIEAYDMNGIRISFESGGNSILFVPAEGEDKYVISGNNWDNGTVEIPYDKSLYRVTAVGINSAADVRLVVKQTDVTKSDKKSRTLSGRKLNQ